MRERGVEEYSATEYSIHLGSERGFGLNANGDYSDLAGAQGKLVVFLASLLSRAGVVGIAEFGSLLSAYAATVSETDPKEGRLLAEWAVAVRLIAPH